MDSKITVKTCTTCEVEKTIDNFGNYTDKRTDKVRIRNECKQCRTKRELERNQNNPTAHNIHSANWKSTNKTKIKEYERERSKINRLIDDQFRIKSDIVSHTRHFMKGERKTYDYINCTHDQIKCWYNHLFPNGMTWEQIDNWQNDHVIPLSFFDLTDPNQILLACHWSNLRPVTKDENIRKNDSIEKELILNHIQVIKDFLKDNNGYQASMETCWWQRVELWYGKNKQDEEDFKNFLKWAIRSEASKV